MTVVGRKRRAELSMEQMRKDMLVASECLYVTPQQREYAVDLIAEICDEFCLQTQTAHLAVNYFDRYACQVAEGGGDFCIISIVCVLVASKFLEIKVPALSELTVNFSHVKYTRTQLKDAELNLLSSLSWKLHHVTPHAFLERLCERQGNLSEACQRRAVFLIDMSYWESATLRKFSPCIVAGAALLCAIQMIEGTGLRDTEMKALCDVCDVDLEGMEVCGETLRRQFFKHYAVRGTERSESPNDVMATMATLNQPVFQPTARSAPSKNHFSPVFADANGDLADVNGDQ
eukprot:CAMPEP_0119380374 /NCGR_PEP_ID=MMETSP1334-20130426/56715_1 /TAXON_ID=127549 /ORGANISM="Calcidiscus leptoporus, Strain RCC1130" /LENGTH=288 /DNA_ID=CAMNT_0007400175 /DNA_START=1 /DNA_END=867 /DNA_ORIENTATION=-